MNEEIKISDEAREAAHREILTWNEEGPMGHHIQLLLNKHDEEIRGLRKDKERLDWLENEGVVKVVGPFGTKKWVCYSTRKPFVAREATVRQAIDAAMPNDPPVTTQMAKICKGTMAYGVCDVCLSMANLSNKQWLIRSPSGERRVQICQECAAMSNETKGGGE